MTMANELDELMGKVITLKSVYSKDRKLVVMPVWNERTRWYEGIPRLSEEDKRGLSFWTDPESKLTVKHNTTFDLSDETDKSNWAWVKHSTDIAMSFEECQKSKTALFYVDNEEIEAQKSLDMDEILFEAMQHVKSDKNDRLADRARILGFEMEGDSPVTIRAFLNKMARDPKSAKQVIEAYTSDSVAIQLLFLKARDKDVIKTERGAFMYGSTPLGITEESVIAFLQDPAHREVVLEIEKQLYPIADKKPAKKQEPKKKTK
jgi:hypothetical protein